jgi:hypothetical protein
MVTRYYKTSDSARTPCDPGYQCVAGVRTATAPTAPTNSPTCAPTAAPTFQTTSTSPTAPTWFPTRAPMTSTPSTSPSTRPTAPISIPTSPPTPDTSFSSSSSSSSNFYITIIIELVVFAVLLFVAMAVWWRREHRKKNNIVRRRANLVPVANPVFSTLGVGEAMASQERSLVDYTLPRTATVHDEPASAPTYEVIDEDSTGAPRRPIYSNTAPDAQAAAPPPPPPPATGVYEEPVPLHVQMANRSELLRQGQRGPAVMLNSEHNNASVPTPHTVDGDLANPLPTVRTSSATPSTRPSYATPSARNSYALPHQLRWSTAMAEESTVDLPTVRHGVRGNGLHGWQASDA